MTKGRKTGGVKKGFVRGYKTGGRTSIVEKNKDYIIHEVSNGIELYDICEFLKCTVSAISNVMANREDYQIARVQGMEMKLRMREMELEAAQDMVSVTRSDKLLRLAQWKLERLASTIYGQKLAVDSQVQINVIVNRGVELEDNSKVVNDIMDHKHEPQPRSGLAAIINGGQDARQTRTSEEEG